MKQRSTLQLGGDYIPTDLDAYGALHVRDGWAAAKLFEHRKWETKIDRFRANDIVLAMVELDEQQALAFGAIQEALHYLRSNSPGEAKAVLDSALKTMRAVLAERKAVEKRSRKRKAKKEGCDLRRDHMPYTIENAHGEVQSTIGNITAARKQAQWASTARAGDYLLLFDDVYAPGQQGDDTRCGLSDAILNAIEAGLGARGLTLVTDAQGLVAAAVDLSVAGARVVR